MRPSALLLAGLLALVLAACGSSASGSGPTTTTTATSTPAGRLRVDAQRYVRATDARSNCETLVTTRFVDAVFGSRARCLATLRSSGASTADVPTVGRITTTGDRGQVAVESASGSGHLAFVRGGDGVWRVDAYGLDYLRDVLRHGVEQTRSGALQDPALRGCLRTRSATMPASLVRRFVYGTIRRDPNLPATLIDLAEQCPGPLSTYVADEIVDRYAATTTLTDARERCLRSQTATFLRLTKLSGKVLRGNPTADRGSTAAAVAGIVKGAQSNCRKRGT